VADRAGLMPGVADTAPELDAPGGTPARTRGRRMLGAHVRPRGACAPFVSSQDAFRRGVVSRSTFQLPSGALRSTPTPGLTCARKVARGGVRLASAGHQGSPCLATTRRAHSPAGATDPPDRPLSPNAGHLRMRPLRPALPQPSRSRSLHALVWGLRCSSVGEPTRATGLGACLRAPTGSPRGPSRRSGSTPRRWHVPYIRPARTGALRPRGLAELGAEVEKVREAKLAKIEAQAFEAAAQLRAASASSSIKFTTTRISG